MSDWVEERINKMLYGKAEDFEDDDTDDGSSEDTDTDEVEESVEDYDSE